MYVVRKAEERDGSQTTQPGPRRLQRGFDLGAGDGTSRNILRCEEDALQRARVGTVVQGRVEDCFGFHPSICPSIHLSVSPSIRQSIQQTATDCHFCPNSYALNLCKVCGAAPSSGVFPDMKTVSGTYCVRICI